MKFIKHLVLLLILFIAVIRIALPYALLRYAEASINKIPQYRVKIGDLDVHLWRGSYTIKNIQLHKLNKNIPVPFFSAQTIDLSIQWKALLHGALVGKMIIDQPKINFVMDPKGQDEQLTIDQQWEHAVKALFPLNFNSITINNGEISLRSYKGNPPFKLYLQNTNFHIVNLQKITDKHTALSSTFSATAETMDGASVKLKGVLDPFASQPTFKLNATLKEMHINNANHFLKHFTKVDVKNGTFSLFVEAAAALGKIKGYAKPIVKNLKVLDPKKKIDPIEFLYKGAIELVSKIVTNPDQETIATKINIEGSIDDPNTSVISVIGYLFRHAFIQALLPQIDHTIKLKDVSLPRPVEKS